MLIQDGDMVMKWVQEMAGSNAFSETTSTLTGITIAAALIITPLIVLGSTGWNYLNNAVKSSLGGESSQFVDYVQIARALTIMCLIGMWRFIYPVLIFVTTSFNQLTDLNSEANQKLIENTKKFTENTYVDPDQFEKIQAADKLKSSENSPEGQAVLAYAEKKNYADAIAVMTKNSKENNGKDEVVESNMITQQEVDDEKSRLGKLVMYMNPGNWGPMVLKSFISLLSGMVRLVVGFFALVVSRALIIVGPLAMMISIIPMYRNKIDEWFGALLPTLLVFTSINIIDNIKYEMMDVFFKDYFTDMVNNSASGELSAISTSVVNTTNTMSMILALEFVTLIAYAMTFWLTAKWIGKSDAGAFMSKSIAVGMGAVALGAKALGGSFGGAGAGAGGKQMNQMLNSIHSAVANLNKKGGGGSQSEDGKPNDPVRG